MNQSSGENLQLRLLIIDDNKDITDIIETVALQASLAVRCVNDYKDIRSEYREFKPEMIFLDLDLGLDKDMDMSERGYDGLRVLKFLSEQLSQARIVLISGMDKDKRQLSRNIGREMQLNIVGSIAKPFAPDLIEQVLTNLKNDLHGGA